MLRKTERLILFLGMLILTVRTASAQSVPGPEAPRRPPETPVGPKTPAPVEPGLRFLSSEMTAAKAITHAPFSAETLTESSQTLGNGASINRRISGKIYRDNEGRTRREMSAVMAGPFASSGDSQRIVFIYDPVAGLSTSFIPGGGGPRANAAPSISDPTGPPGAETVMENSYVESLGTKMIESFEAYGERTSIVIPVGRIGNDKPIEIVHERWYSNELNTLLYSKHSDPRWGETTYKLLNINRGEPDRSLFVLPAPASPPGATEGKKVRPRR